MNFVCPHCGSPQIVTDRAFSKFSTYAYVGAFAEMQDGDGADASCLSITGEVVCCADPECSRLTVVLELGSGRTTSQGTRLISETGFLSTRIYPSASGKPFPVGVPAPLLQDYREAWSIIDLSPKASATLARRCLQAMIRDFCDIHERTLYHEIEALEAKLKADELPKGVEPETIAAMKVLKDKGNIGAHMTEIDGVIVDVDAGEAEQLLGLIEMLFADWYVARHKRQERLAAIVAMAAPQRKPEGESAGA